MEKEEKVKIPSAEITLPGHGEVNGHAITGDSTAGAGPAAASAGPQSVAVPPGAMEPASTLTEPQTSEQQICTTKDNFPQPKVYDFSWVRVLTLTILFAPTVPMFLLIFTEIGFGATVMKRLSTTSSFWTRAVGGVGFFTIFLLHMFDFTYWRTPLFRVLRLLGLAAFSFCCLIAVALSFTSRPYAPILAYFVMVCLGFTMIYVRWVTLPQSCE